MITKVACWEVECDVDKTSALYAEFDGPSCRCGYCRNFWTAMDSAFPQDFRLLASRLGIDVAKPTEVWQYYRESSGLHYYGGLFHFSGQIVFDPRKPSTPGSPTEFERLVSGFELTLGQKGFLIPECFKGHQLVHLDFATHVPWVLDEPDPG